MLKIKYLILNFTFLFLLGNAQAQLGHKAELVFENAFHDLGELNAGDLVEMEFEFINAGRQPLIITEVKTTCGCTVADFPKTPVMKGEKRKIRVTYHATEPGAFQKTITVISNSKNKDEEIVIEGFVK